MHTFMCEYKYSIIMFMNGILSLDYMLFNQRLQYLFCIAHRICVCVLNRFSHVQLCATLWTSAR